MTPERVGWGATHVRGFPELSDVAFEERNPIFNRIIGVSLRSTQSTQYWRFKIYFLNDL